jgi:hypothetical protein
VQKGPFGRALRRFFETVRRAEADIAQLRGELDRGAINDQVSAAPGRPKQANILEATKEPLPGRGDRSHYTASQGHT